jgi:hypothetical protein
VPAKRVNARELEFRSLQPADQKMACYPVEVVPSPIVVEPTAPNRKEGMQFYRQSVSPQEYRDRMERGEAASPSLPEWARDNREE